MERGLRCPPGIYALEDSALWLWTAHADFLVSVWGQSGPSDPKFPQVVG